MYVNFVINFLNKSPLRTNTLNSFKLRFG